MSLCFEEFKTISDFIEKLLDSYIDDFAFIIKDLKIQYKDSIKYISYSNCIKGMLELLPEYSDYLIKLHYDNDSVLITFDNPEIYALLSLYLL